MKVPRHPTARCPRCGSRRAIDKGDDTFQCSSCGAWFDMDPDEGGDYSRS